MGKNQKDQNRKNQNKDKLNSKLKAKLKKKLQQVKESGSPEQKNVQQNTEKPTLTSTEGPYSRPNVVKFNNDEISTSNNKNDKLSESKPSKSQLKKQKAKLAKKQKQSVDLVVNETTKYNGTKPVTTATKTKKEPLHDKPKGKKKKKNKLNEKINPTKSLKRQSDKIKATSANKRMKVVNGFVEIDANDQEDISVVGKKLQKKKSKLKQMQKKRENLDSPVIVHKVPEKALNSETNSDSEDDSYIDRFFNESDEEFDENRVYSQDEIESKKVNGFLYKGSEDGLSSDHDPSSDDNNGCENSDCINHMPNYNDDSDISFRSEDQCNRHELDHALIISKNGSVTFSEYQSDEKEINYDDSSDMEVESDDYNSEMEEESDDDYSYSEGSDYSNESDQSDESSDAYENFMHGQSHDSDDDHEYTGEQMFSIIDFIVL